MTGEAVRVSDCIADGRGGSRAPAATTSRACRLRQPCRPKCVDTFFTYIKSRREGPECFLPMFGKKGAHRLQNPRRQGAGQQLAGDEVDRRVFGAAPHADVRSLVPLGSVEVEPVTGDSCPARTHSAPTPRHRASGKAWQSLPARSPAAADLDRGGGKINSPEPAHWPGPGRLTSIFHGKSRDTGVEKPKVPALQGKMGLSKSPTTLAERHLVDAE